MDAIEQAEELHIDLDALMKIIVRSTEVRNSKELRELIGTDVTEILHHDVVPSRDGHKPLSRHPGSLDTTAAGMDKTASHPDHDRETTPEPIVFQVGRDDQAHPPTWVNIFKKYGLRDIDEHGALDLQRMFGNHFIFSNITDVAGERETFLLKLLVPYLHFALMRTQDNSETPMNRQETGSSESHADPAGEKQ